MKVAEEPPAAPGAAATGETTGRSHAVGDLVVVAVFVLAGMTEHGTATDPIGVARNLAIFLGTWAAVSWITRLYRAPTGGRSVSIQLVITWVGAVSCGIALRAVLLGRAIDRAQLVFWAVAMALTGAMLLGWRLLYLTARKLFGR